jgi:hypothetical protein
VPINTIWQANRKGVIINHVLYPLDSLNKPGTSSIIAILSKSSFEAGGREPGKKPPLHVSEEMLKPVEGISPLLPSDYLIIEETSKEATLLRMSTLLVPKLPGMHIQSGEISTTAQK